MSVFEAPPRRACVLVVDDDDAVVEAAAEMLEDHGYAVLVAYSGEQAWITMQNHAPGPDIVLLGVAVPGDRCWSLLRRVQLAPAVAHIPVVVMSALGSDLLADASAAAACVSKPLAPEALLETIRFALWRRGREAPEARTCRYVSDYPD